MKQRLLYLAIVAMFAVAIGSAANDISIQPVCVADTVAIVDTIAIVDTVKIVRNDEVVIN